MGALFGFTPPTTPGTSNNAPRPVPILGSSGGNMVGGNKGGGAPNIPMFGNITPTANQGIFGNTGLQNLSSSIWPTGPAGDQFYKQLSQAFGPGGAGAIAQVLNNLFNPQVAASFLNSMQPGVNRGLAGLQQSFGAEGNRFGSAAALGIGDYLSQVNLNEQQVLSNMFLTAQGEELNLLQNLLPTLHAEQANHSGILSDILGGLETAGGLASMFIPGLQGVGASLIGGGISTITGGNKGGGGGGSSPGFSPIFQPSMIPGVQGTPPFIAPGTNIDPALLQQISAGGSLGGNDPFSSTGDTSGASDLSEFLMLGH